MPEPPGETGHPRTVDINRGHRTSEVPLICPGASSTALKTPTAYFFFFFFSGFPPAAAVLRMTNRGRAVPTVLNGALEREGDTQGSFWACPCLQLAPFIIRLQFHSVSCSEAGGGSETLSLTHSATVKTKLLLLGYQTII